MKLTILFFITQTSIQLVPTKISKNRLFCFVIKYFALNKLNFGIFNQKSILTQPHITLLNHPEEIYLIVNLFPITLDQILMQYKITSLS